MFKSKNVILSLSTATVLAISTSTVYASDDDVHGLNEHHAFNKNTVGVFGGFTSIGGDTEATFGIEYERRFTQLVGVGIVWEKTPNAHNGDGTSIFMGQIHLHPWQELRLSVGYGKEKIHHEGTHKVDVWRFGVAYDFHMEGFGIAPTFNLDRIDGHTAKVFGIVLNKGF